ncbi:hypothetical protein JTB14_033614 [Gonioctena quinquepunctata]|nr:hypothetical protein JTB14_033614 [Gonioctena quinquepunctata]
MTTDVQDACPTWRRPSETASRRRRRHPRVGSGTETVALRRSGRLWNNSCVHLDIITVENRGGGQSGPGGTRGLLGESRVASNIRGFFATRIGSALPDTG